VTQRPRLVVGISGFSAPHYGIALLETSHALGSVDTHLVHSDGARRTIQLEADLDPELVGRLADVVHHPNNLAAPISWGHFCSTARWQVLIYHFMFGPSYADGCPVNSSIADA